MTLNGPITSAWLTPWKNYLRLQGVKFFIGRIKSLEMLGSRLVPIIEGPDGAQGLVPENVYDVYTLPASVDQVDQHRFILAVSLQQASDLIWDAFRRTNLLPSSFNGPFAQLVEFDTRTGRRGPGDPAAREPARDPATGKPSGVGYPLRTISGLQYFFTQEYRVGEGNIYFVSAPWALTSISQFAYWRDRIRPVGELLGQISVDVGDWHAYYPSELSSTLSNSHGNTAWYSSCQEVALNTWAQIRQGLPTEFAKLITPPRYFHIDSNIVFETYKHQGFGGSAMLRFLTPSALAPRSSGNLITFTLSYDKWSPYRRETPVLTVSTDVISAEALGSGLVDVAEVVAEDIKQRLGRYLLAISIKGDLVVSPKVESTRVIIGFRGETKSLCYLCINDEWKEFTVDTRMRRHGILHDAVTELGARFGASFELEPLDDIQTSFALKRTDGQAFLTTLINLDGAIEIVDGPQLEVKTNSTAIWLVNPVHPGSTRVMSGAVRANAVIRPLVGATTTSGVQAGRLYGVGVGVGAGEVTAFISYEAKSGDTPSDVRNAVFERMDEMGQFVLRDSHDDRQPSRTSSIPCIVLSPIVELAATVIRVTQTSDQTFKIVIDEQHISLDGQGKDVDAILAEIASSIRNRLSYLSVGPVVSQTLPIKVRSGHSREVFKIGVLNVDGAIELIGAPALTIEVKDMYLEPPNTGFLVLRNNAEFLISLPDQWHWRPGLYRGEAAKKIPPDYVALCKCFGDAMPEIYYGHENPPLEHWTCAGTYMATYTRMSTMEAANESGRHAAAAIINALVRDDGGGSGEMVRPKYAALVGDLPQIWKMEEFELEDLRFFTELDNALFSADLPHVFDILSITPLVNALLEIELCEDHVQEFLNQLRKIGETLTPQLLHGVSVGGQAVSRLVGAYRDLTGSVLDTIRGADPASELTRTFLTDRLKEMSQLAEYYQSLWGQSGHKN